MAESCLHNFPSLLKSSDFLPWKYLFWRFLERKKIIRKGGEGLRRAFCTNVSLLKETDSNVFYYYCESNFREVLESAQQVFLVFYHGISLSFLSLQGEISARHLCKRKKKSVRDTSSSHFFLMKHGKLRSRNHPTLPEHLSKEFSSLVNYFWRDNNSPWASTPICQIKN